MENLHCLRKLLSLHSLVLQCLNIYIEYGKKLSLLPKIPDKIFIVSSNEISNGFFVIIRFVYLVFSSLPTFRRNSDFFFFVRSLFAYFRKNRLVSKKIAGEGHSIVLAKLEFS